VKAYGSNAHGSDAWRGKGHSPLGRNLAWDIRQDKRSYEMTPNAAHWLNEIKESMKYKELL